MVTAPATLRSRFQVPLWSKRVHSWWFAGQVVANLIAAWLIMRLVWEMEWAELGLGALVGRIA